MEAEHRAAGSGADAPACRDGFTALYDAHVSEVYRYVHRLCGDAALAEDVTQDAFMAAVETVDDPASIGVGWLMRVARNRLFDVLRRRTRYRTKLWLVRGGMTDQDESETVVDQLRVREALDALSIDQRLLLTMHYAEGLTIAELAEELGRSPKTIEARVTRARSNFRKALEAADE